MKRIYLLLSALFYLITPSNAQNLSYHYDFLNRVSKIHCTNRAIIHYSYDALGNRLTTIQINVQSAVLYVTPLKDTVNSSVGSLTFSIQNKGKGTMNWKVVSNDNWLSIIGKTSGINADTIIVNYTANMGVSRDGSITVTSLEANNSPQAITIHQAAFTFSNHLWHIKPTGSDITGNGSVDRPFATIQKGIDIAATGDTVLVYPGTYYENLNISSKNLEIVSMWEFSTDSSYIANTIIDGNKKGSVFTLSNISSSAVFNGFTITNGLDTTQNGSGGAFNLVNSNPKLTNLIIKNNIAQYGGAINCYKSSPYLYNVKINNNTATYEGGGISCNQSRPVMQNCVINFNTSYKNGGGLTLYNGSNAKIVNTLISNNKATLGGGAISIFNNSSPDFINITLSNNHASHSPGIQSSSSSPTITNSIIWNKSYFDNAVITYSDIRDGRAGVGNIDSYPEFQDTTMYNYSLKCTSPCLNSGNPDTTGLETESNDILGNPRIFDNIIDMGAFEYQGSAIPGKPDSIIGDTAVCQGSTGVTYSVPDITGATSYIWTLPSGVTGKSNTNSISVNFDSMTVSGNIKVMGSNICGAGAPSSIAIIVNILPSTPTVDTIIQTTCSVATGSVILTNLPSGNWTINPGGITGSTSATTISGLASGTYIYTVTNAAGCSSDASADVVINAQPATPPTPIISLLNDSTLQSDATMGNQWYNQTGLINGAVNQEYIVKSSGDYYALVTINNGCVSDTSNIINVVISGITLYGGQKTITIYPNPVKKELIIELKGNTKNIDFEILNSLGKVVFKGKLLEKTIVQTSNFARGIYIIRFEKGNNLEFKKVIKE